MNNRTHQDLRVSFALSHPVQYVAPLLVALAGKLDLHVYYFSDDSVKGKIDKEFGTEVKWDVPLLENYDYTFLKNYSPNPGVTNQFFGLINPGIIRALRRDNSSIIIVNGWGYFSTVLTLIAGRLLGKKVWVRGENPGSQETQKPALLLFLKKILLKGILFRFVHKFLYIGKENREFYKMYGARDSQLVYTPYAVDNDFFAKKAIELSSQTGLIKNELGIPADKKVILTSGKYITKKRPMDVLRAFRQLGNTDVVLVMVGDGELRGEMENYIRENSLENVYLTGFINQSQISKYYAVSDVFVMCSGPGETWGLSVNEAMNFSKPIVVTDTCGCSSDLVKNGYNGFIVQEGNVDSLAKAIMTLTNDNELRVLAGRRSKEIVEDYSIRTIVTNIEKAALATV